MDLLLNNHQTRGLHSLRILNEIETHRELMMSVKNVLDIDSGIGLDSEWWATRTDLDDENPQPLDIDVHAISYVDEMKQEVTNLPNVEYNTAPWKFWEGPIKSKKFDVVWGHCFLHKYHDPYEVLRGINTLQEKDGLLCITVPKINNFFYNEPDVRVYPKVYTDINIVNLIYGLALAGYDCRDAYFLQDRNSNLLNFVGYKDSNDTYEPNEVTVYDLLEMERLPTSMIQQMEKFGYISNKNLLLSWMDGTLVDYSSI
jgi:SAM-dependent methyltransferase